MRRNKRSFLFLIIGILSLISFIYLILTYSPNTQFSIFNFQISILIGFLLLLFVSIYFLFSFIFTNKKRGFLIALFTVIYLILRLNNLAHPFFLILLLILFGSIELLFAKRK